MSRLKFSPAASAALKSLAADPALKKRHKAVCRALGKMEADLRYPGLNTHEMKSRKCPHDSKLFTAYAENNTSGAYRIFWCYEPSMADTVLIVQIGPHE